jgi:hypothetical protein
MILLPQPPYWDYRCAPPYPAHLLFIKILWGIHY